MQNVKLTLAYDGTHYCGYQWQDNAVTVQGKLDAALQKVYPEENIVSYCASRTDSGVHARGQVVNYFCQKALPQSKLALAINFFLPRDIRVMAAQYVCPDFRARQDAKQKRYRYYLYHHPIMDPFWRNYALHVREAVLDYAKMETAAQDYVGTYNFSPFQGLQGADPGVDPVKTMHRVDLYRSNDHPIAYFEVVGNAFLYKMVRIMVGTLLDIGKGKLDQQVVGTSLEQQDRSLVGPTAKPHGLFLEQIWYGKERPLTT